MESFRFTPKMSNNQRLLWMLLIFASLMFSKNITKAQEILNSYVQEGLERNLSLQVQELDYQTSIQALREAKGLYLPQVSFQASYTLAGGGRALQFPIGDLFNPVYQTLNGLTGEQRFPTDLENVDETFLPNNFHETKLRIIQPIFNPDIKYNKLIRERMLSAQGASKEAYELELSKEIKTAYYVFLQTETVLGIYDESENLLIELLRVNQRLVDEQKATYEVVSNTKFELSKLDQEKATAETQRQRAQAYFNFLLNAPLDRPIEIDTSLQASTQLWDQLLALQDQAVNNRAELRQLQAGIEAQELNVQMNEASFLPRVNAVLDMGFQGFKYTFDQDQDFWLGQISLSWDLFNGNQRKARLAQSQLAKQTLSKQEAASQQQIRLQVEEKFYELMASRKALSASLSGQAHARDVYRIKNKKYIEDQASLLELTEARTQYVQAQIQTVINQYQLLINQAELEWTVGLNGEQ